MLNKFNTQIPKRLASQTLGITPPSEAIRCFSDEKHQPPRKLVAGVSHQPGAKRETGAKRAGGSFQRALLRRTRVFHTRVLALTLGALLSVAACDETAETAVPVTATRPSDASPPAPNPALGKRPEDVKYEATISGLTRYMRDLRFAIMGNDEPATGLLVASLRLEEHLLWMARVFGNELGAALSARYQPQSDEIGLLVRVLREQFDKGLTEIQVYRFQTATATSATGYQSAALRRMVAPEALYSVRLSNKDRTHSFHLWSFVHDKGSFRFVGKLRGVAEPKPLDGRDLNEYRLSDAERLTAQAAKKRSP